MNADRHLIALTDAAPGDRLAEPVLDDQGQVLVGAGCELTAGLIQSLARRGVTGLCIARVAAAGLEVEEVCQATRHERASARIAHLFRHTTRQGRVSPLMHSVLQHRLGGPP